MNEKLTNYNRLTFKKIYARLVSRIFKIGTYVPIGFRIILSNNTSY
jgi:hypothetical protein